MKKKGIELLGSHAINLIIAILAILILIYGGVKLAGLFTEKAEKENAEFELIQLKAKLDTALRTGEGDSYLVTTTKGWYMFSDEFGSLCEGDFCLCLCEEIDCSSESRACVSTEFFVLLREGGERNRELRFFQLTSPYELKLGISQEKVYPFSAAEKSVSVQIWRNRINSVSPLFFKYEEEWLWSPDLEVWMKLSEEKVKSGKWEGFPPNKNNLEFLRALNRVSNAENSEEIGIDVFLKRGSKESDKVLIIGK
jgi:hypothetical protein